MKRMFAVLLAFLLVFSCLPISSYAAEAYGYEVIVSPDPVAIGNEVTLTIRLTDYTSEKSPLVGFQIDITDADGLLRNAVCTSLAADKENLLSDVANYQPSRNIVRHLYAKSDGTMDYSVSDLLEVKFTIPKTDTEAGTLSLPLRILLENEAGDHLTYHDQIRIEYGKTGDVTRPKLRIEAESSHITAGDSLQLTAAIEPEGKELPELVWSIPEEFAHLATVSETGLVTTNAVEETTEITVFLAAADDSCESAQIQLTILPAIHILDAKGGEPITQLLSKKSASYKLLDGATGKFFAAKSVKWSLRPEDAAIASVNSSGKLTVKTVYERQTVVLTAQVADNEALRCSLAVEILPATTNVELLLDEAPVLGTIPLAPDSTLKLCAVSYPEDTLGTVTWTTSNQKVAAVSPEGVVTGVKDGTVTITATVADGSKKKASVKVEVGTMVKEVTIAAPVSTVRSGKALQLTASTAPVKKAVTWQVDNPKIASVSGSGKLTAKTVYEPTKVVVTAAAKDAGAASGTYTITILPKDDQVLVIRSGDENVTASTLSVDLTASVQLKAFTGETEETVTWKSSSKKIVEVEPDGTLKLLKPGKATITAACGKRTAKVTIQVSAQVQGITVSSKTGLLEVASGKTLALTASVQPANATNKAVTWKILTQNPNAKISASGVLTAEKDLTQIKEIQIQAVAKDGSGVASAPITIKLRPIATGAVIYDGGIIRTAKTVDIKDGSVNLTAQVYPWRAMQDVTWSISNQKVATVVNGTVTLLKPGTVTITAAAADGSKQKATIKLTVVSSITKLSLADQNLAAGKSLNLAKLLEIDPKTTTTKKFTWEFTDPDYAKYATLSSSGTLKAKKVTQVRTVRIRVTAQDPLGCSAECDVKIFPNAVSKLLILSDSVNMTGKTLTMAPDQTLGLTKSIYPDEACTEVTWSSSNPSVATVDTESGVVTAHKEGRTTITCQATDGSGKKATVTIRVEAPNLSD